MQSTLIYPTKKIGNGATVFSGYAFKSKDFTAYGIPVIKIKNVNERMVDFSDVQCFPESKLSTKINKFLLNDEDILIAMTGQGSVGRVGKIRLKEGQKVLLNQRVGKFLINEQKLDREYLYQVISSQEYEQILFDTGNGSSQPNLSPEMILDVDIPFPDLEIQKKIGIILSSLDNKIWTTMMININLEKIIQSIFKSWFVDFDGQTEFTDSELGDIPEGWECVKIQDLINNNILYENQDGNHGERHPKVNDYVSSGIPFIMAANIKNNTLDCINCKFITKKQAELLRIGFAKPNDVLLTHKATIGRVDIVPKTYPFIMLTPQVTYFRIKDERKLSNLYLKYFFLSAYFQNQLNSISSQSTRDYIGILAQRELYIILPPPEKIKEFHSLISCFHDKIMINRSLFTILSNIRDSLLSKLIFREIKISN